MAVPGRKEERGRSRRKWMGLTRADMVKKGAVEGDEVDLVKWRRMTRCGSPK